MHRLRILGIFAALALLIAACGEPTPPPDTTYTLTVTVDGDGTVHFNTPAGDVVPAESDYAAGTEVTLVAVDGADAFVEWGGACDGTETTCKVTMDGDKLVTATFETETEPLPDSVPMTVVIEGDVGGTVTQTELGINCTYDGVAASGDCAADAIPTTEATTFTATPDTDMSVEWVDIEACADGATECAVTANANPFVLTVRFFDPSGPEQLEGAVKVADDADDGFEWKATSNSNHQPGWSHHSLNFVGLSYLPRYEAEIVSAFIFRDLGIPAGAQIDEAEIVFHAIEQNCCQATPVDSYDLSDGADTTLVFTAEASPDPTNVAGIMTIETGTPEPITSRDTVAVSLPITITDEWTGRGDPQPPVLGLAELLQAVVDQEGWNESGDAMIIISHATGGAAAATGWRQASQHDQGADFAAELKFKYTVP